MRLDPDDYYASDVASHTSQGDIYTDVPFVWRTRIRSADKEPAGKRRRPAEPGEAEGDLEMVAAGIVSNYTCGFVAQPAGTPGYAHPFRFVAPILPVAMLSHAGMPDGQLEGLVQNGGANGFMYLPGAPFGFDDDHDSPWAGHAAACLYRITTVGQSVLDNRERIGRLSAAAHKVLCSRLMQLVSPNWFPPDELGLREPDRSDSWQPSG